MAAKTQNQDFTAMFKDMMGAFPIDTKSMDEAFKTQSGFAEKLSAVSIEAAQKSADLTAKWTQDVLSKVAEMTKAKDEPADYAKAMADFATAQAETASEHMAAFAEIAKKVQSETMQLMLSASKEMGEEMSEAAQKATKDMTAAAKKATAK